MEKYECLKCGQTSYTAYKSASTKCPYCTAEKIFILNSNLVLSPHELSNAKIFVDRRMQETPVELERRANIKLTPVAWLVTRHEEPTFA